MENWYDKLIGAQILSIDESAIKVRKGEKLYEIDIHECDGDCCGFNEISANLLIDGDESPVITNVKFERIPNTAYDESDRVIITFFGEYKPIAELESRSSSQSGWNYGAYVEVVCDELDIDEVLTEW